MRHLPIVKFLLIFLLALSAHSVLAAPRARLAQSDARLLAIETQLFQLINADRARDGLNRLRYDEKLAQVARAHSAEMRDEKYFSHQSPTPLLEWPLDRYEKGMSATPQMIAENLYRSWSNRRGIPSDAARKAHQSLMNSPGHRGNILLPRAVRLGVGVVSDDHGNLWITEMFARP